MEEKNIGIQKRLLPLVPPIFTLVWLFNFPFTLNRDQFLSEVFLRADYRDLYKGTDLILRNDSTYEIEEFHIFHLSSYSGEYSRCDDTLYLDVKDTTVLWDILIIDSNRLSPPTPNGIGFRILEDSENETDGLFIKRYNALYILAKASR